MQKSFYLPLVLLLISVIICFQLAGCNGTEPQDEVSEEAATEEAEGEGGDEEEGEETPDGEETSKEESSDENGDKEEPEEPTSDKEQKEEAGENDEEETSESKEAPAIELSIYEGPLYSEEDDVCYYRIEAIITGNPQPEVEFLKDDSNSAWGEGKCQVNLYNPEDTYKLIATATNSEGSATASLDLCWECELEEDVEAPDLMTSNLQDLIQSVEMEALLRPYVILSPVNIGYAIKNDGINYESVIIGDSIQNMDVRGFFDFDTTGLIGKEIVSATLALRNPTIYGDPSFKGNCIKVMNLYHFTQLDSYSLGSGVIVKEDCTGNMDIVVSEYLEEIIRDTIDPRCGNKMLKFKIFYTNDSSDGDSQIDAREYAREDISLIVWYNN